MPRQLSATANTLSGSVKLEAQVYWTEKLVAIYARKHHEQQGGWLWNMCKLDGIQRKTQHTKKYKQWEKLELATLVPACCVDYFIACCVFVWIPLDLSAYTCSYNWLFTLKLLQVKRIIILATISDEYMEAKRSRRSNIRALHRCFYY